MKKKSEKMVVGSNSISMRWKRASLTPLKHWVIAIKGPL
jgi:hypothetical protein